MFDDAAAAEGVQTLDDGGRVYVIPVAKHAYQVRVDVAEERAGRRHADGPRRRRLGQGARVHGAARRHHFGGGRRRRLAPPGTTKGTQRGRARSR